MTGDLLSGILSLAATWWILKVINNSSAPCAMLWFKSFAIQVTSLHKRRFVISEEVWDDGVFWGRVDLFGLNLHFYFGLLVAWKKEQYLNSKKHKKEQNGAQKSDTTKALARPSAQDSTRTRRKRRRRTVQSSWHNTLVSLRNSTVVIHLEVMTIDNLPFAMMPIAKTVHTERNSNRRKIQPLITLTEIYQYPQSLSLHKISCKILRLSK